MPEIIDFKFVGHRRTRTNERHLAAKNVPELRKFVQTRFTKESAYGRHSGIVRDLVDHGLPRVAFFATGLTGNKSLDVLLMDLWVVVRVHRSELQTPKASSKPSKPLLLENHRALGRQLDCQGNSRENGAGNQEQKSAPRDINDTLHDSRKALLRST